MSNSTRLRFLLCCSVLGLSACNGTAGVTSPVSAPVTNSTAARYLATGQQIVSSGQLICQVGPTVLQALDPSGAAVLAKGATKAAVNAACASVGGMATALNDVSVTPKGIVVTLPPTLTIPTQPIS